ncbi:MAG: hypothetical protein JXA62_05240 [Candidatus Aminicenantes bacterium]|nr:hypothetical protein [Candidatus Aminicenantes bacterium]
MTENPVYGWKASLIVFGGFGLLLQIETRFLIPFLNRKTGREPIIFWLLLVGWERFLKD